MPTKKPDWDRLYALMEGVDTHQSIEELTPAFDRREIPEPRWAPDYVPALESALEQRKHEDLLYLLERGLLIHPVLLSALAEVLRRALDTPKKQGRRPALLSMQKTDLQRLHAELVGPGKMTMNDFETYWAKALGVSEDTIKRAVRVQKR